MIYMFAPLKLILETLVPYAFKTQLLSEESQGFTQSLELDIHFTCTDILLEDTHLKVPIIHCHFPKEGSGHWLMCTMNRR